MKIGIPTETRLGETRVAATPETVRKLTARHRVIVQAGAGLPASIADEAYVAAGATIGSAAQAFGCQVVLKMRAPNAEERMLLNRGAVLLGMLDRFNAKTIAVLATSGVQVFSLTAVPRLTPAQSIDVLSSYSDIAMYKAVMMAAHLAPLHSEADGSDVYRERRTRADHSRNAGRKGSVASGAVA